MNEKEQCRQCVHSQRCQEIYKKLGGSEGDSVAVKVIVAFLVPILTFIGALLLFEKLLARIVAVGKPASSVIAAVLAALAAFGAILLARTVAGLTKKQKQ